MPINRIFVLLTLLLFGSVSCDLGGGPYFQDKVNEVTQEKVAKRYGFPHETRALQTGGEAWTYYDRGSGTASYTGYATSTYCRAYVLTFDKEGVLRDWAQQECHN